MHLIELMKMFIEFGCQETMTICLLLFEELDVPIDYVGFMWEKEDISRFDIATYYLVLVEVVNTINHFYE